MKKTFALAMILVTVLSSCNFLPGGGNGASTVTMPSTTEVNGADPTATAAMDKTPGVLLFSDEFNGTSLASPFRPLPIWFSSPDVTDENVNAQAIWTPESVHVADGYLHLRADKLPSPQHDRPYSSGYVQSGGYWHDQGAPSLWFQYGYFEARIKAPAIAGTWPAFWLWSDPRSTREIDIVEIIMRKPNVTYHTVHNDGEIFQVSKTYPDPLDHWHTYAVDWQPGLIVWYVDGVEAGRYEDPGNVFDQAMYLVLSYQLGGDWAGRVDESQLPAEMLVDYVHVWSTKP